VTEVPQRGPGAEPRLGVCVPQQLKLFVKLHIKFALKYNKQQLLPLLDKINLAAKYENSKLLGDITMDVPSSELLGGHVPLSHRDRRPCQLYIRRR